MSRKKKDAWHTIRVTLPVPIDPSRAAIVRQLIGRLSGTLELLRELDNESYAMLTPATSSQAQRQGQVGHGNRSTPARRSRKSMRRQR